MIVFAGTRPKPTIALHEGGEQIECRALSDRALIGLVCSADDIAFATSGRPMPAAANKLLDLLHAYQAGYRRPSYRGDEDQEVDQALRMAAAALQPSGLVFIVAGKGRRITGAGEEVAVVLLSDRTLSSCLVQVDLDAAWESAQ